MSEKPKLLTRKEGSVKKSKRKKSKGLDMPLYEAAKKYVEWHGGTALVGCGIQVQKWPADPPRVYRLAVSFVGKCPPVRMQEGVLVPPKPWE